VKGVFWASLGALAWTHVGYPAAAALGARLRPRPVRKGDVLPAVTVVVAAHNEEAVIERRLQNLLELDYPAELVDVVVASDASTDRTDELVEAMAAAEERVRLLRCPRGGKVAGQNLAVRDARGDIVAFSDANSTWAPDALRRLVRNLADDDVAYVCGKVVLQTDEGRNKEGVYWRYELLVRASESWLGSITGGNGAIYALRRFDYVEVDPRFGHDLSLPYVLARDGRRAVYEPEALAFEKATPTTEDEYRRKVRMFEHCWAIVAEGRMLRGQKPLYALELVSHRHLRYASGALHAALLGSSLLLLGSGRSYRLAFAAQVGLLGAAVARVGLARYYVLVSWATLEALVNYARRGVPAVWEQAEGTR
jgi:cellulose synthase/poly-beta-1,6-N-acetylglucosamine synthase-like glycosyltransferase